VSPGWWDRYDPWVTWRSTVALSHFRQVNHMSSERYYLVSVSRLSEHWRVEPSRVASGYCWTDVVTDQDKLRLTANLPSCLPSPSSEKVFSWKTLLISTVEVAISNSDPYKNYPESFRGFSQSSHNIPGQNHKLSCDGILLYSSLPLIATIPPLLATIPPLLATIPPFNAVSD